MISDLVDNFFYDEMMVHPALFLHRKPRTLLIIDDNPGFIAEALKHPQLENIYCVCADPQISDPRITYCPPCWLNSQQADSIDVIIAGPNATNFSQYAHLLHTEGIMVTPCPYSIFDLMAVKPLIQSIESCGFKNLQLLTFPQPSFSIGNGTRTLILVSKEAKLKRIREKDLYNRDFGTRFYNLDTHRAAMALPEFVRSELETT